LGEVASLSRAEFTPGHARKSDEQSRAVRARGNAALGLPAALILPALVKLMSCLRSPMRHPKNATGDSHEEKGDDSGKIRVTIEQSDQNA
jgi:hypothetical protein